MRGAAGLAGAAGFVGLGGRSFAMTMPTAPVALNVIDVAGNLALTQKSIEAYRASHAAVVSSITFGKAPAPELAGKLKAQQDAGRVDIDLVLTGTDGLSAGIAQGLWIEVLAGLRRRPAQPDDIYLPGRRKMQTLAQGQGVVVDLLPVRSAARVHAGQGDDPPTTAEELLAWAKANPNRFQYARPANSGPGRTFLMGLPYILGDNDPKDPVNGWDKTWAYLKELGQYVDVLPVRYRRDDEEPRQRLARHDRQHHRLGHQPARARHRAEGGQDRHAEGLPLGHRRALRGRAQGRLQTTSSPRILDLLQFMLTPAAAGDRLRQGLLLPGPAVKDVPLSMAPQESQDAIRSSAARSTTS